MNMNKLVLIFFFIIMSLLAGAGESVSYFTDNDYVIIENSDTLESILSQWIFSGRLGLINEKSNNCYRDFGLTGKSERVTKKYYVKADKGIAYKLYISTYEHKPYFPFFKKKPC